MMLGRCLVCPGTMSGTVWTSVSHPMLEPRGQPVFPGDSEACPCPFLLFQQLLIPLQIQDWPPGRSLHFLRPGATQPVLLDSPGAITG